MSNDTYPSTSQGILIAKGDHLHEDALKNIQSYTNSKVLLIKFYSTHKKTTLDRRNSRSDIEGKKINELQDIAIEILKNYSYNKGIKF